MKAIKLCIAACLAACACASVYAQTSPDTNAAGLQSTAATPASAQGAQSNGGPLHAMTRAEVYQQLIEAEKDGQLAYLNSTVYAH